MRRERDTTAGPRIRAALARPELASATVQQVAEATGDSPHTVRYWRRVLAQRGHLRITARQVELLTQVFEVSARGGDIRAILATQDGRELHANLVETRQKALKNQWFEK